MADINFIGATSLGKINSWEDKKASTITPISFPGKNAGETEGVDTLGVIAYFNFSGRMTGNFDRIQDTLFALKNIADGMQISARTLKSPFVNSVDRNESRKQGSIGQNDSTTASQLKDSGAFFLDNGVVENDIVKNFITGEIATVTTNPTSNTVLDLSADIFPVAGGIGISYGVTATINIKLLSITSRWELPGLSYCDYQISVMQVV